MDLRPFLEFNSSKETSVPPMAAVKVSRTEVVQSWVLVLDGSWIIILLLEPFVVL